jgi:hypothetical protein
MSICEYLLIHGTETQQQDVTYRCIPELPVLMWNQTALSCTSFLKVPGSNIGLKTTFPDVLRGLVILFKQCLYELWEGIRFPLYYCYYHPIYHADMKATSDSLCVKELTGRSSLYKNTILSTDNYMYSYTHMALASTVILVL